MGENHQSRIPVIRSDSYGQEALVDFERIISMIISRADANVIHQRLAVAAGTVLAAAFTGDQCDVPRNVKVVDNGVGAGNTGNVVVTGLDQYGSAQTETIAITNGGTAQGVKAFTYISQIVFPAITDTNIEVQVASKIGIPGDLRSDGLKTVAKDAAGGGAKTFMLASAFTVETIYDTVEETGVAVVAGDQYDYYIKG